MYVRTYMYSVYMHKYMYINVYMYKSIPGTINTVRDGVELWYVGNNY